MIQMITRNPQIDEQYFSNECIESLYEQVPIQFDSQPHDDLNDPQNFPLSTLE